MTLVIKTLVLLKIVILSVQVLHITDCLPSSGAANQRDKLITPQKSSLNENDAQGVAHEGGNSPSKENQKDAIKDYRGWRLVRLYPRTPKMVKDILDVIEGKAGVNVYSVSKEASYTEVDLAISPGAKLGHLLPSSDFPLLCSLDRISQDGGPVSGSDCSVHVENDDEKTGVNKRRSRSLYMLEWKTILQDLSISLLPATTRQLAGNGAMTWENYHRYDTILQFSKDLSETYKNVGFINIGQSLENRTLFALVFGTNPDFAKRKYEKRVAIASELLVNGGTRILARRKKKKSMKKASTDEGPLKARSKNNKKTKIKAGKTGKGKTSVKKKKKKKKNSVNKSKKKKPTDKIKKPKTKKKAKPVVLIEAGAHAREWISPAVATYFAEQLAKVGDNFLKEVTVLLVPLANPDGYEYSHTNDRLWRKNRRNPTSGCPGVDLNRNWNISWGSEVGASLDPCSYQYCGNESFSEPETAAIRDLAAVFLRDMKLYLSLHSYGQLVLHPWGHTEDKPPKHGKLKSMGRKLVSALNKNNDYNHFRGGQSSHMLYYSAGTSDDFMYSLGVPYSYTLELPNTYSFELLPELIRPTAESIWAALVCFLGDVIATPKARSFCSKRIVTVTTNDNVTVSAWVKKRVPLSRAKVIVLERFNANSN